MISGIDKNIAQEFKKKLTGVIPILDFVIFGSRARGDATFESDLDVFIKVEQITPVQRDQISEIACDVGYERDRVITTFVATSNHLENGPLGANPIMLQIENEGIRL